MPGARCTRSLACENKKAHEHSHYGHAEIIRHSPRNGCAAYNVISPVIGLCCHRHRRNYFRRFDASVEASGPHDFAVRFTRCSSAAHQRPSHPVPRSWRSRAAPLGGTGPDRSIPASTWASS